MPESAANPLFKSEILRYRRGFTRGDSLGGTLP